MRIQTAYARYIREYLLVKGCNKSVLVHIRAGSRLFVEIVGNVYLSDLTLEDVAKFAAGLGHYGGNRTQNTVRVYLIQLRTVLRYWRLRGEDVLDADMIPIPKPVPTKPAFLTKEEVDLVIKQATSIRAKFLVSLLYSSGLRISEVQTLNRDTIRNGMFTVIGKGQKERICFTDARTEYFMQKYLESRSDRSEALIATNFGNRASVQTLKAIVHRAAIQSGIKKKISAHTFRHSFATNYVYNNGNIKHLATMLGHSSTQTTEIYTHIVDYDLLREYKEHHSF